MADAWLNDMMVCYIKRGLFGLDLTEIKKRISKEKMKNAIAKVYTQIKLYYGYVFPTTRFI